MNINIILHNPKENPANPAAMHITVFDASKTTNRPVLYRNTIIVLDIVSLILCKTHVVQIHRVPHYYANYTLLRFS